MRFISEASRRKPRGPVEHESPGEVERRRFRAGKRVGYPNSARISSGRRSGRTGGRHEVLPGAARLGALRARTGRCTTMARRLRRFPRINGQGAFDRRPLRGREPLGIVEANRRPAMCFGGCPPHPREPSGPPGRPMPECLAIRCRLLPEPGIGPGIGTERFDPFGAVAAMLPAADGPASEASAIRRSGGLWPSLRQAASAVFGISGRSPAADRSGREAVRSNCSPGLRRCYQPDHGRIDGFCTANGTMSLLTP